VNGTSREYILDVPEDYDPTHPYPIVFGWHWRGGDAGQVANGQGASFGPYYGLRQLAEGKAIFVAPEGLVDNGNSGWANPMGRDIAFASAMLDRFESELCVDTERVFSTGFSFGGMFSFAVGCALADRFRAIAPIAGSLWSGCAEGSDPIAVWGTHGATDGVVEIPHGRTARDEFLTRNGCSATSTPTEPNGCVSYEGCAEGYPVVWCEYNDGHWPPNYAATETWKFFSSF
jgi:poly(3-hydroxybutyrate) depolymerase